MSPYFDAGPFTSRWQGNLHLKINDYYVFSTRGRGSVKLNINGTTILESKGPDLHDVKSEEIDMFKGPNRIEVTYESLANGDAEFRLYWWNPLQPVEPIAPESFTFDPNDLELKGGLRKRSGRQLFAESRCIRCHRPDASFGSQSMPELAMDAPAFTGIGERLNADWISNWLVNPTATRLTARMPRMLQGDSLTISTDAHDIATFLASLKDGDWPKGNSALSLDDQIQIDSGANRFATLGCVACHVLPGDESLDNDSRTRLDHVRQKWQVSALVSFLRNPSRHYEWIRMPHFALTEDEATELAIYVFSRCAELARPNFSHGDSANGRDLVGDLGCLDCHSLDGMTTRLKSPDLAQIAGTDGLTGCISKVSSSGHHPLYDFTDEERATLRGFLTNDLPSLNRVVWTEFSERQIGRLRCGACHTRDGKSDFWSAIIAADPPSVPAEEDLIDDFDDAFGDEIDDFGDVFADEEPSQTETNIHIARPPLTWAGEKLHFDWMRQFIAGTLPYKPRVQLKGRMPGFPPYARGLALGMTLGHGFSPVKPALPLAEPGLVKTGSQLVQMDGLGCASCHALGDQGALSGPASEAINLKYATARLRKHYFDRYVLDPQRLFPGTMMPKFVDEEGYSPITDVFDGDAAQQYHAIWNYLIQLGHSN